MEVTTLHEAAGWWPSLPIWADQSRNKCRQIDREGESLREINTGIPHSARKEIAERIRAPEAMEMVPRLVEGHETVIRTARDLVGTAEEGGDVATADLATERIEVHEKAAWMLRTTAS